VSVGDTILRGVQSSISQYIPRTITRRSKIDVQIFAIMFHKIESITILSVFCR
jgi:hypothetical protein